MLRYTVICLQLLSVSGCGIAGSDETSTPADVLQSSDLDLPEEVTVHEPVSVGQLITVSFQIHNRRESAVELMAPVASCGCMTPTLSESVIAPGASATVRVDVRAGQKPEVLMKQIKFFQSNGQPIGNVRVRIAVSADIWCEPPVVEIRLDENERGQGRVAVQWDDTKCRFQDIGLKDDGLSIDEIESRANQRTFLVSATRATKSLATIRYSTGGSRDVIEKSILVHAAKQPSFTVTPGRVHLLFTESKPCVKQSLVVSFGEPAECTELIVTPLDELCKVGEIRCLNPGRFLIELQILNSTSTGKVAQRPLVDIATADPKSGHYVVQAFQTN